MTRRWLLGLLALGVLSAGWAWLPTAEASKRVIGPTAQVEVAEAGMDFIGRVDTGAASTSVHAESLRVEGEMVIFEVVNRLGERVELRRPLMKTKLVRNPEGSERRLFVELTLRHQGLTKQVVANLNDRSGLTYALLLGRDWLQDDFVVDVACEPTASLEGETSGPAKPGKLASR